MLKTTFRLRFLALALAALGCAFGAAAQGTGNTGGDTPPAATRAQGGAGEMKSRLGSSERRFVQKAAMGGLAEVRLGDLAQQKGSHEQIRQFGSRMVADHGKANDQLKSLASSKGLSLPVEVDRQHRRDMERLQKLSGAEFDRAYMKLMVSHHKEDVADFRRQARSGQDAELKDFAATNLPVLEEHLQLAQSTESALRSGGKDMPAASGTTTKP